MQGFGREVAYVRVLMDRDMADEEHPPDLGKISKALDSLVRAVRAQHGIGAQSDDSLAGTIAGVIEKVGGQMGLPKALR